MHVFFLCIALILATRGFLLGGLGVELRLDVTLERKQQSDSIIAFEY